MARQRRPTLAVALALTCGIAGPSGPARAAGAALLAGPAAPAAPAAPTASAPVDAAKVQLKAAIVPLIVEGELPESDRQVLLERLVDGLQRGAFAVIGPDAVQQADPKAASCSDARCFGALGRSTGATHVVRATVRVVDRDYDVAVELIDVAGGRTVATTAEGCEICGVVDAGNLIATAAATLRTKLEALAVGPSTLEIASDPAGAIVTIDGEVVGVTPLQRPVVAGKRLIRVAADGFVSVEREVTVVEGVTESLAVTLEKVPSRLPGRPWGWASLGVGLVVLGGAAALTAFDDSEVKSDCSGENRDAQGRCRFLWDFKWGALGAAVAGAALTTLGVVVLVDSAQRRKDGAGDSAGGRGRKRSAARTRPLQLGLGPASLQLRGRF